MSHRLHHFRPPYCDWSLINVILGGEVFTELAESLQEALQRLGGAPFEHRTDSLSAAIINLKKSEQEDPTAGYRAGCCLHYGMTLTLNNR